MGLLDNFTLNRSLAMLLDSPEASNTERLQALSNLKRHSRRAIPKLIRELAAPERPEPIIELLVALLDNSTLALYFDGLTRPSSRVVQATVQVLSRPGKYDPNRLLDLFQDPNIPKAQLAEILAAQKSALSGKALLRLLDTMDKDSRTPIYRLLDESATEELVPELLRRLSSDDWLMRFNVTRMLRRFGMPAVRDALIKLLEDPHKTVRQAALEGLAGLKIPVDVGPICKLLKDPDLTVQTRAIEAICQINDPNSIQYLLDILQDDSEYVRRAAVEVLNRIGNTNAIKDLLGALRDKDWWVRVRAGDALGTIGGPKVVEAILALVKDEDEFIRRAAVEVLNITKDERAFAYLVEALKDHDWWVRERSADALAALGDKRAVPALLDLLERSPESAPAAIKALGALGDTRAIRPLVAALKRPERQVREEALRALAGLTDEQNASGVHRAVKELLEANTAEVRQTAADTLRTLVTRFGGGARPVERAPRRFPEDRFPEHRSPEHRSPEHRSPEHRSPEHRSAERLRASAQSTLMPYQSLLYADGPGGRADLLAEEAMRRQRALAEAAESTFTVPQLIDPAMLQPGTMLGDRYRVVRNVGSGAFGVVLLVEDVVVHEEIILKFLKHHMAADENVIKRFIHELRYARKITHENVIRIHDFITFGKSYAISMEYFPSHPLSAEMKGGKPIEPQRAIKILQDICKGMLVAHQADVVHRDLKPANVLINDDDLVKIVDFGLAAAGSHMDSRLTTAGFLVGTPTYMAPEQVSGGVFDARTDIYSLGIIMYEMFTGRPPYVGRDPMAVLYQHIEGKAAPPSQMNPDISPALEAVILKAMALKPPDRYRSMDELRRSLESLEEAV